MASDCELTTTGLAVLEDLAALLMEAAHEVAVHTAPPGHDERLGRVADLRRTGADLVAIADACEVPIRRSGAPTAETEAEAPASS